VAIIDNISGSGKYRQNIYIITLTNAFKYLFIMIFSWHIKLILRRNFMSGSTSSDDQHFSSERELHNHFLEIGPLLDSQFSRVFVRSEVPVGRCIPDLVYVGISRIPTSFSWPKHFSFMHAYIISTLRDEKSLTLNEIANICYEKPNRIKSIVDELESVKILSKNRLDSYKLTRGFSNIKAEVISVEVKLQKWRKALHQAINYQKFSDKTMVVLDKSRIPKKSDYIAQFENDNVGLLLLGYDSHEWCVEPGNYKIKHSANREYLINSAISSGSYKSWFALNDCSA
jgi:hypothetical protein